MKLTLPASSVNWKELYVHRHAADREVRRLLDGIISCQTGRIERSHTVLKHGYDAKDVLLQEIQSAPGKDDCLARK